MSQPSISLQTPLFPVTQPLNLPEAVLSEYHAPHLSSRYGHIRSANVIEALTLEDYSITKIGTTRGSKFGKHVMTLEHGQANGQGYTPQIVIVNSHDGSSAYRLHVGLFEHKTGLCLIVGTEWGKLRVQHTKGVVTEVVNATRQLAQESPKLNLVIQAMRNHILTLEQQREYAELALRARYKDDLCPISSDELLWSNSHSLAPRSIWEVFQRCQEIGRAHV